MQIELIPAGMLYPSHDARPIVETRVSALAESIRDIGLINPIVVRRALKIRNGAQGDAWEILAGHHRYTACAKRLRWTEIPCVVREASDLQSELVAIDENLCREELSPAQEAYQTARRKEIYEILHPEAAAGLSQAAGMNTRLGRGRQIGDHVDRFTADTSTRTGRSERAVQRDAARGEALGVDLHRVAGTSLDKGVELDALTKLNPRDREDIVRRAQQGETVSARAVARPIPPSIPAEAVENNRLTAWRRLWNKADQDDRWAIAAEVLAWANEQEGKSP